MSKTIRSVRILILIPQRSYRKLLNNSRCASKGLALKSQHGVVTLEVISNSRILRLLVTHIEARQLRSIRIELGVVVFGELL